MRKKVLLLILASFMFIVSFQPFDTVLSEDQAAPFSNLVYQSAADTCPQIVQEAIATIQTVCDPTNRNQTCYGNAPINAQPKPVAVDFKFDTVGDMADVIDLQSIRLSPMNLSSLEWGIALMRLQANLPDASLENLSMLLFGDVELSENPSAGYGPMQAFTLRTGANDAPCDAAPESGLLIQTPEGVGEVRILVNEVIVNLGSTGFLQAVPNGNLTLQVLEGRGSLEALGALQEIPAGAESSVQLNPAGQAISAPSEAQPYEIEHPAVFEQLSEALPRTIEVAAPIPEPEADSGGGESETIPPSDESSQSTPPPAARPNRPIIGGLAPADVPPSDAPIVRGDGQDDDNSIVRRPPAPPPDPSLPIPTLDPHIPLPNLDIQWSSCFSSGVTLVSFFILNMPSDAASLLVDLDGQVISLSTTQNTATFSSVPPGMYTITITALNSASLPVAQGSASGVCT